ncbi:Argininosuccinate lyase [Variovorax sp. PBS-H4]|uniref:Bug family tripartite tricarboxylate transporter substrate binding protein n=1 Tax=Variovorax sp. PBS-H4 TaxID=434008 RepID=UPI00131672F2|nr:tripartite tricarboxylate transporter substrate-binding protein [Variovorax sp. PBS-H4]VTU39180.1 Argininosuccinate lyase [Variovorax sp. PBS-H4]
MFHSPLSAAAIVMAAAILAPSAAQAEEKQPLKIIVGFPAGGSADTLTRMMADGLRNDFSPVIVENRAGAAGRIAITAVKNAKPDGQTVIIMPNGPMVLFPHVYKKLDYDPVKDFTPISLLARFQFGLVAGPGAGVKTVSEMLKKVKADPASGTYGTAGAGTLPHFLGQMFSQAAGVNLQHIPFQGGAPANTALLGGHINYKFDVIVETAEFHRAGKVRILAVTGAKRDPQIPDVPTLKESGVDMVADAWFGMYAPQGLSPATREKLERAVVAAIKQPELRERMQRQGYEPVGSTGVELAATQAADLRRWEAPVKATGVTLD